MRTNCRPGSDRSARVLDAMEGAARVAVPNGAGQAVAGASIQFVGGDLSAPAEQIPIIEVELSGAASVEQCPETRVRRC